MDRRERNREAAERDIVDAAYALFSDRGFDDTTVEMIAERAAVSPRTVYRYFVTKEAIVLGELDGEIDRIVARVRSGCADGVTMARLLAAMEERFADRQHQPRFRTLTALLRDNPSLMERADAWRRRLAYAIAGAVAELEGAPAPRPADAARGVAAVSVTATGIAVWAREHHRRDLAEVLRECAAAVFGDPR